LAWPSAAGSQGWIYDLTGSYHMAFINGIAWNFLPISGSWCCPDTLAPCMRAGGGDFNPKFRIRGRRLPAPDAPRHRLRPVAICFWRLAEPGVLVPSSLRLVAQVMAGNASFECGMAAVLRQESGGGRAWARSVRASLSPWPDQTHADRKKKHSPCHVLVFCWPHLRDAISGCTFK